MAGPHVLKWQATIPASLTRTPMQVMGKITEAAAEVIIRMVPNAYDRDWKRIYRERQTRKFGPVWDVLVGMSFRHRGPLPPNVSQLKLHHEIQKKMKEQGLSKHLLH